MHKNDSDFLICWRYYQKIFSGCSIDYPKYIDLDLRHKIIPCDSRNQKLVIINKDRGHNREIIAAITRDYDRHTQPGVRVLSDFIDFGRYYRESIFSPAMIWVIKLCFTRPFILFKSLLGRHDKYLVLKYLISDYFKKNNICEVHFFTSNNRITELIRLVALVEGVACTEFLHGITSDNFSRYYDLLSDISLATGAKLSYVNMLPKLPQPDSIVKNLAVVENKELYYKNEVKWKKSAGYIFQVLIIGGAVSNSCYKDSKYFENELKTIEYCIRNGFSVAYCPHPKIEKTIVKDIPQNIPITSVSESMLSSQIIVGHYSTVLFTGHLLGLNVLIYEDARSVLPKNIQTLFADINNNTYSDKLLRQKLLNIRNFTNVSELDGVNLEKS